MNPLVSVCIPTFNRAGYLKIAIESALQQTFSNFELLVLDDASTDDTEVLVRSFNDTRIRYRKNPKNIGYVLNWNKCLSEARGEYVKFLLDDDTFEPEMLRRQSEALNRLPKVGFVGCDINLIDATGGLHPDQGAARPYRLFQKDTEEPGATFIPRYIADRRAIGVPTSIMFRRELALPEGFDVEADFAADGEMWCRLATRSNFFYVDQHLCNIRLHESNVSNVVTKKDLFNYRKMYYLVHKIFSSYTFTNPRDREDLQAVRRRAFWNVTQWAINNATKTDDSAARRAIFEDIHTSEPFALNRFASKLLWMYLIPARVRRQPRT